MLKQTFRQFAVGLVSIGLLLAPAVQAQQQGKTIPPDLPCETCGGGGGGGGSNTIINPAITVPAGVSLGVVQAAQSTATAVQSHIYAGHFANTDASAMYGALSAQFANWDESGFTITIQNWVKGNSVLFTTQTPTTAQLQAGYAQLQAIGIRVTYAQYSAAVTGQPLTVREQFLSIVNTYGLKNIHHMILRQLSVMTAKNRELNPDLQYASLQGGHLKRICMDEVPDDGEDDSAYVPGTGHFLLMGTQPTPPWLSIAGLYLTIVALAVTGPVGIGIAVVGAALTGAGLVSGG